MDVFSGEEGDSSCDIKQGEIFLNWIRLGRNMKNAKGKEKGSELLRKIRKVRKTT